MQYLLTAKKPQLPIPAKNLATVNLIPVCQYYCCNNSSVTVLAHHRRVRRPCEPCPSEQREEGAVCYACFSPEPIHHPRCNDHTEECPSLENTGERSNETVTLCCRLARVGIEEVHVHHERRLAKAEVYVSRYYLKDSAAVTYVTPMIDAGYPNAIWPSDTRKQIQKLRQLYWSSPASFEVAMAGAVKRYTKERKIASDA